MTRLRRPAIAAPDEFSPFTGMLAALHAQPFDGSLRTFLLLGAVLVVAWLVRDVDTLARLAAGGLLTGAVTAIVVAACRRRWRAEDVLAWHSGERDREWIARTGGPAPLEPEEAEIWLGVHQVGQVPDYERALAAQRAGDPRASRMVAALPGSTPAERADRAWAFFVGGVVVRPAAPLADGIASGDRIRRVAVAIMAAGGAFTTGAESWLAALVQARSLTGRPRLGRARTLRYWAFRLRAPIGAALEFALLTFLVLPTLPAAPVDDGSLGPRGAGTVDRQQLYADIPAIRAALESAQPYAGTFNDQLPERILARGLPSVIWYPGDPPPNLPGAAGRKVTAAEIFLGLEPPVVLVTFVGDSHPTAAWTVDPSLRALLLAAVGLVRPSGSPTP